MNLSNLPMAQAQGLKPLKITNSMSGEKEVFRSLEPGKVRFYTCGPTVYGQIHIGNLRSALVADMVVRALKKFGYEVIYVRNYTDVDDKIIAQAKQQGMTPEALAKKYTLEAEKDYALAGMLDPTHKPTVTDHIREIIELIESLVARGLAYVIESGEVLFSIEKFEAYGKLSGKKIEDLVAGIRVDINEKKKNPLDFSLWKPAKPEEPYWDSPWGKGRPGWHIECSAMAKKWLGDQVDIHHGGEDLVFPHHENEIAQSEGASGKPPYVRYWVHSAFLTLSKTKMSKSLGNVYYARDFLAAQGGELTRLLLLGVHYRSLIDFDPSLVEQSISQLSRIYEAKLKATEMLQQKKARSDLRAESTWGTFLAHVEKTKVEIEDAYAQDFNTPGVLAALFVLIREFNRVLTEPMALATPGALLGARELIRVIEEDVGQVLGVGLKHPESALNELGQIQSRLKKNEGIDVPTESEILQAIEERKQARIEKDFARGDQIRKDLESRGVLIKDSPQGTTWSYRS